MNTNNAQFQTHTAQKGSKTSPCTHVSIEGQELRAGENHKQREPLKLNGKSCTNSIFPQSDTTPKIHRLFPRLCQGCVLCSPSDKVRTPLLFLLDGGARRNNLAQCIACGTGGQARRENKTSGKLYLERSFSTVRKGPPVPGVFFWDHLVIILDKGEPRLVIKVQNHPIIYGVSGLT